MKKNNPFPTITSEGNTYKLRSRNMIVPDFSTMNDIEIDIWLIRNTWAKGYYKEPNPLIGLGISVN